MAQGVLIVFRVDGSARIGGGHVMRCLALADALAARGAKALFVCAELSSGLASRVGAAGHELVRIDPPAPSDGDWDRGVDPAELQRADARRTIAAVAPEQADWLVVDHYRLDATWEDEARSVAPSLLAIDDLANRRHACSLLLDQNLGRRASDYHELVPDGAGILAGPLFALLRPAFAAARPRALRRRRTVEAPRRMLISLGMTERAALVGELVTAVLETLPDTDVDLVLPRAPDGGFASDRVRVHVDVPDLVELAGAADIAIGAAGTAAWERCCLGLPSLLLVLADNQRPGAKALENVGAARIVAGAADVSAALRAFAQDPAALARMSAAAFAIVDGEGAARMASRLLEEPADVGEVRIRAAAESDSEAIWLWRNDPVTRRFSQTGDPIAWADHARWWERVSADPLCRHWIAMSDDESVGVVRFDPEESEPGAFTVSINLRPDRRGGGLGRAVLAAAVAAFERNQGGAKLRAFISPDNPASAHIFAALGFAPAGLAAPSGFHLYERAARPAAEEGGERA